MPEQMHDLLLRPKPTADRPLAGQTVLVVDDSRFTSDALRLICMRSGARMRRADSLSAAERHLATYRPSVVVIDLGLPDGHGTSLIADLKRAEPPVPVVLAISGDSGAASAARAAGADGFLAKPIESVAMFQSAVLSGMPRANHPPGPRALTEEAVTPDRLALQDDLSTIARAISRPEATDRVPYIAQFLAGVARSARDRPLEDAARALAGLGAGTRDEALRGLAAMVNQRLEGRVAV